VDLRKITEGGPYHTHATACNCICTYPSTG
jgi:hypothetical protein